MLTLRVYISFVLCLHGVKSEQTIIQDSYTRWEDVNFISLQQEGCLEQVTLTSTNVYQLQCGAQCSRSDTCLGFLWIPNKSCLLQNSDTCSQTSNNNFQEKKDEIFYFRKNSESDFCNGDWDENDKKCKCIDGRVGPPFCREFGKSCKDLHIDRSYPRQKKLDVQLKPYGNTLRRVQCYIGRHLIHTSVAFKTKKVFAKRKWGEYVAGFNSEDSGNDDLSDFWLGLDLLHHFTKNINRMFIIIRSKMNSMRYSFKNVKVNGPEDSYSVFGMLDKMANLNGTKWANKSRDHIDSFDCFSINGDPTPFTVPDNDSKIEISGSACNDLMISGWWFSGCNPVCNPLGDFYGCSGYATGLKPNDIHLYDLTENDACDIDFVDVKLVEHK